MEREPEPEFFLLKYLARDFFIPGVTAVKMDNFFIDNAADRPELSFCCLMQRESHIRSVGGNANTIPGVSDKFPDSREKGVFVRFKMDQQQLLRLLTSSEFQGFLQTQINRSKLHS